MCENICKSYTDKSLVPIIYNELLHLESLYNPSKK